MKDYNKLINKLLRISEDMHWQLLTEAAMAIRELQQDAARYRWLRDTELLDDVRDILAYECGTRADEMIDAAMKGTE